MQMAYNLQDSERIVVQFTKESVYNRIIQVKCPLKIYFLLREMFMGTLSEMYIQCFFVGFFVDPGPLSPDPTLVGKKEI